MCRSCRYQVLCKTLLRVVADLPVLPRTMVGLAILTGLRRGELFALRWKDIDEQNQLLTVREAVYDSTFSAPKTAAGLRQIPLSELARLLIAEWRAMATNVEPDTLVFATSQGTPILPNKVVRRSIFPACHANVDTTLNVYTQVLDGSVKAAVEKVGSELFQLFTNREIRGGVDPVGD